jgi:hypothetical protein
MEKDARNRRNYMNRLSDKEIIKLCHDVQIGTGGMDQTDALDVVIKWVKEQAWIPVEQQLPYPNENHCWLAWITSQNKNGGYIDLVSYGDYIFQNYDCKPGDPNYVEDNDDGNMRGSGWYREEETHGGEYDYVFVPLNGKVAFWRSMPTPPVSPPLPYQGKEPGR